MSTPCKVRKTSGEELIAQVKPDGFIRLEIDNFSEFTSKSSPIVEIYGIPWKLVALAKTIPPYASKTFSIIMHSNVGCESTLWECTIDRKIYIINRDIARSVGDERIDILSKKRTWTGGHYHTSWRSFIDPKKGFICDNKVTVEAWIYVKNFLGMACKPRFDFSSSNTRSNAILVIEGQKIYVNKQYLALCSDIFQALFFGDFVEKNKKEIELKDVVYEEFIELLQVIYPSCKRITDDSAEFLLKLGDRFQIVCLVDRVKRFLDKHSEISALDMRRLGSAYNLNLLRASSPSSSPSYYDDEFKAVKFIDFSTKDIHSNTTMLIDGKAVHVNKQYLALYSEIFQNMFVGFFTKAKKEFKLEDVIFEEFIELLHVIYPSSKKITDESVEFLLKLGKRFEIACVVERAEAFLMTSLKFTVVEKLLIAEQFRLFKLQHHCLSSLTTGADFRNVRGSPIYRKLSDSTKAALFELMTKNVM